MKKPKKEELEKAIRLAKKEIKEWTKFLKEAEEKLKNL